MDSNYGMFLESTNKKWLKSCVDREIDKELQNENCILHHRRERLKMKLKEEWLGFHNEIDETRQKISELLAEQRAVQALEIQTARELERKEDAEKKIQQLLRENSEEERDRISTQKQAEAISAVRYQIEEKKYQLARERKIEEIWNEVMKQYLELRGFSENNPKMSPKTYSHILLDQINEKVQALKEEKYKGFEETLALRKLAEEFESELRRENEEKLKKMRLQGNDKLYQLIISREMKKKQQEEEKLFDELCSKVSLSFGCDEKDPNEKKREHKLELDLYKSTVDAIKEKREAEEKFEEDLRSKEMMTVIDKLHIAHLEEKMKQQKLQKDVMEIRMQQIMNKRRLGPS